MRTTLTVAVAAALLSVLSARPSPTMAADARGDVSSALRAGQSSPGSGTSAGPCAGIQARSPRLLVVTRVTRPPHPRNFVNTRYRRWKVTARQAVTEIYRVVCALHHVHPTSRQIKSCNGGPGTSYHLTFSTGTRHILRVSVSATNCNDLFVGPRALGGGTEYLLGRSRFWDHLAHVLGVRKTTLFPHLSQGAGTGGTP